MPSAFIGQAWGTNPGRWSARHQALHLTLPRPNLDDLDVYYASDRTSKSMAILLISLLLAGTGVLNGWPESCRDPRRQPAPGNLPGKANARQRKELLLCVQGDTRFSKSARRVQRMCGAVQRLRQHGQLLRRARLVLGVNRFVYARNHDGGIASVFARSVDGVLVPGSIG